jgi:hypothetical protein
MQQFVSAAFQALAGSLKALGIDRLCGEVGLLEIGEGEYDKVSPATNNLRSHELEWDEVLRTALSLLPNSAISSSLYIWEGSGASIVRTDTASLSASAHSSRAVTRYRHVCKISGFQRRRSSRIHCSRRAWCSCCHCSCRLSRSSCHCSSRSFFSRRPVSNCVTNPTVRAAPAPMSAAKNVGHGLSVAAAAAVIALTLESSRAISPRASGCCPARSLQGVLILNSYSNRVMSVQRSAWWSYPERCANGHEWGVLG